MSLASGKEYSETSDCLRTVTVGSKWFVVGHIDYLLRGKQGLLVEILQSDNSHANTKFFGENTGVGDEKCYELKAVGSKLYAGCTTNSAGWSQDSSTDVMFWKLDQAAFTID